MLNLDSLNEAQRQAVMHGEGPLLVLAGPGSGKTFTITQRILYLTEVQKVPPEEILVITFTKEAALSMQRRFQEQYEGKQVLPVNFGTFHSVFYQILKQSSISCTGQLWQEHQKINLMKTILKEYHSDEERLFLCAISYYKNTDDREKAEKILPESERKYFQNVWERYEAERRKQGAMDFDDMVYECARLLEADRDARAYWSSRFSHILMDEFQDINPMQYRVIRQLAGAPYNLFAVGDDDQAIYGFRGSKPACMKQFEKDYGAKRVLLNINYRSLPDIVQASSKVIACNKERFEKNLKPAHEMPSANKKEANEEKSVAVRSFREQEEQYAYLLEQMQQSTRDTATVAVLFRTNTHMQLFAARLRKKGIPFEIKERKGDIQEHFVAKDIFAYMRLAAGEGDRELYLRVLNKPKREPGERGRLEKQLKYMGQTTPYLAVQYLCRVMGYEGYLRERSRMNRTEADQLEEWIGIIDFLKEEAKEYRTLQEWLGEHEKRKLTKTVESGANIHLMTVHASKGLEFDKVYIPYCNEKIFPYGSMPSAETCEEERRIFYVAMTRAKKSLELLYLTGTKERPRLPSRYLNPLLKNYSSSISSSNSQLSRYSSKASATFSYSSSSSIQLNSGSSLGSSGFSL